MILSGDVAELREEGTSVDEVLRRADQVLYRAKAVGRGQVIAA